METIKPNKVSRFIRKELREKIFSDFNNYPFRIFRERDLHASCYYHLRQFLFGDLSWEILNEPFLRDLKCKGKGAQPDIALIRRGKLYFIIELKFRRKLSGIQNKDHMVLNNSVKNKKWARKAYFIETVVEPLRETGLTGTPYRNKYIIIAMSKEKRKEFLSIYNKRRRPEPRN
ncbi:MAG TPA: hypothetical protein PLT92_14165 [Ignavibacteriaceae bacterium]|nr:hypothetical protein [Ignavibacteriaceae bacterium]